MSPMAKGYSLFILIILIDFCTVSNFQYRIGVCFNEYGVAKKLYLRIRGKWERLLLE